MRVLSLLSALFFFLLAGSNAAFAHESNRGSKAVSTTKLSENHPSKITTESQSLTLIEDTDSGQEEEFQSGSKSICKDSYFGKWQTAKIFRRAFALISPSDTYSKNHFLQTGLFANSCPVYLAHRVLRL